MRSPRIHKSIAASPTCLSNRKARPNRLGFLRVRRCATARPRHGPTAADWSFTCLRVRIPPQWYNFLFELTLSPPLSFSPPFVLNIPFLSHVYTLSLALQQARILAIISITLIFVSIVSLVLETEPALAGYVTLWSSIEILCVSYFTAEYALRFLSARLDAWSFCTNFSNVMDAVSILPFYIFLIYTAVSDAGGGGGDHTSTVDSGPALFRVLRVVRIFRVFRISRYVSWFKVCARTLKNCMCLCSCV